MPISNNGATVEDTLIQICKKITGQNGKLNIDQPLHRILKLKKYPNNWQAFIKEFEKELKDIGRGIVHQDMTIACIQILSDRQA